LMIAATYSSLFVFLLSFRAASRRRVQMSHHEKKQDYWYRQLQQHPSWPRQLNKMKNEPSMAIAIIHRVVAPISNFPSQNDDDNKNNF
jgi:hypothetical protein